MSPRQVRSLGLALAALLVTAAPAAFGQPAPAAPAPPPPASAPAAAPAAPATGEGYSVQLKQLEQRVSELKEQIFRSKARLNLLKETVLHGVIAGSRAMILFKNEMGSAFKLVKVVFALDGVQIKALSDETGKLNDAEKFEVFNGAIVPGPHTVMVMLVYRGSGFGVFNYFKGYKFTVRSSHTFTAGEGKLTEITARGYEKGNITTPLAERPAVDFKLNVLSEKPAGQPAAKK
ncbi:MAG TPA: dihydrolipoamide acetyltransferase [Polyangia bacterium]